MAPTGGPVSGIDSLTSEYPGPRRAGRRPRIAGSELYICGPDAWADIVEREARRSGLAGPR